MKKFSKILVLCLVVCLAVGALAACSKFGPIGTMQYANEDAINNGGLVVQQGKYLYYVNGMDATSNITKPSDNYFGNASVKGSIMKSEINDDGSLGETAVVVPKMFYTSATNGGFYIYGEWIYYLSPSTKTDNVSNVLTSQLVAARTKIDGTKTQEIATLSANTTQYVFTDSEFIYYENNTLSKVSYDNSKVTKKSVALAEEVSSVLFTQKSTTIFFIKSASENSPRRNNNMYVCVDGEVKAITTDETYADSANDLSKQFTYALVSYDASENVLFYTKAANNNDASKTTSTYGYKFGDDFAFDASKEQKFAVNALSSFVSLGFEKGLMDTSAATLKLYKPIAANATQDDTEDYATLSATGAKIIKIEGEYMYYVLSNSLYRIAYADKDAQKKADGFTLISAATADKDDSGKIAVAINTSWLTISLLGDYMYYIDNTYNYMYRLNLKDFVREPNKVVYAYGEIVSGYRKATLTKEEDGSIKVNYVADDANEEGVTYYQIPKFMTEDDINTYATAIYVEPEEEE
ncbi:MAG: DUF5050 domain-containing protein [Clostridia bacterium]|nr:DUF5050 domain-containing protein [Clostridia bacterium]MDE7328550.1 DUF5050 domain-containing protein [Clostridia bacterium]